VMYKVPLFIYTGQYVYNYMVYVPMYVALTKGGGREEGGG